MPEADPGSKQGVNIDVTEATTEYSPFTRAYIDAADSQNKSAVTAAGNVIVAADAIFHGVTVAGNAAYNGKGTSIAPSAAVTSHTADTNSFVNNANVIANGNAPGGGPALSSVLTGDSGQSQTDSNFTGVSVTANSKQVVTTVAAGIGVTGGESNGVNVAASITINLLDETTGANVSHATTINSTPNAGRSAKQSINVFANNDTTVHGGGGALGISGGKTWGIGAGADGGSITTKTTAHVASAQANAENNVYVQAYSSETLDSYEGAVELGSQGTAQIAGALSAYVLDLTTQAWIGIDDGNPKYDSSQCWWQRAGRGAGRHIGSYGRRCHSNCHQWKAEPGCQSWLASIQTEANRGVHCGAVDGDGDRRIIDGPDQRG